MLLEKQKSNPNKMATNRPTSNQIPVSPRAFGDTKPVITSLMLLISMLFILPIVLIVVVMAGTGLIKFSTSLVLGVLFVSFYCMILYSIYIILNYYLSPLDSYIDRVEQIR